MRLRVWIVALMALLLLPGAVDAAESKKALMLSVFGTSTEASITFDEILPLVQKQFPGRTVVIPYTSSIIRNKLNADISDPAKKILSPAEMLEKLKTEGYTDIAVVSTLTFPGVENDKLQEAVKTFSQANKAITTSYTPPMLSDPANMQPVVNTLKKYLSATGENIVVAHGSHPGHPVEKVYLELARTVAATYPNARVASVEGLPSMEDALAQVAKAKATEVRFLIFMFVAGDHAEKDVSSDDPDSFFTAVRKAGKTPSVAWVETSAGKRIASLGLDPDYRKLLLAHYAKYVAK